MNIVTSRNTPLNETWEEYKNRICKDMLINDIAFVSVQLATIRYIRAQQSVYVTFVDKISACGGTLGLFTGMSILSVVKMVYWMFKISMTLLTDDCNQGALLFFATNWSIWLTIDWIILSNSKPYFISKIFSIWPFLVKNIGHSTPFLITTELYTTWRRISCNHCMEHLLCTLNDEQMHVIELQIYQNT